MHGLEDLIVETERIWKWMDGPEAGQTYTCSNQPLLNSGGPGATISGCSEQSYLNWLVLQW